MNTRICGGLALMAVLAGAGTGLAQSDNSGSGRVPAAPTPASTLADKAGQGQGATGKDAWDALAKEFGGFKSDTKPSRDAVMQFSQAGEVREINVAGGQRVKKGEVLMRVRDAEVVGAIERQKVLAANTLEIQNAEKQLDLAQFKFDQLKAGKTFSPTEFEELKIGADAAKIQRDQAKVNFETQKLALTQMYGQAERYRLEAPFDGVIEEVMVEVGQGVTENEKILRIVNTENLWLDAYADTAETIRLGLKENSPAWVLVQLADSPKLVKGKVLYVSPVADSVSQTRRVRVEIENPENWPAGTQSRVRFTEPSGDWNQYSKPSNNKVSAADQLDVSEPVAKLLAQAWASVEYYASINTDDINYGYSIVDAHIHSLFSFVPEKASYWQSRNVILAAPEEQREWYGRPRVARDYQEAFPKPLSTEDRRWIAGTIVTTDHRVALVEGNTK